MLLQRRCAHIAHSSQRMSKTRTDAHPINPRAQFVRSLCAVCAQFVRSLASLTAGRVHFEPVRKLGYGLSLQSICYKPLRVLQAWRRCRLAGGFLFGYLVQGDLGSGVIERQSVQSLGEARPLMF